MWYWVGEERLEQPPARYWYVTLHSFSKFLLNNPAFSLIFERTPLKFWRPDGFARFVRPTYGQPKTNLQRTPIESDRTQGAPARSWGGIRTVPKKLTALRQSYLQWTKYRAPIHTNPKVQQARDRKPVSNLEERSLYLRGLAMLQALMALRVVTSMIVHV